MRWWDFILAIGSYNLVYGIVSYVFGNEPIPPEVLVFVGLINLIMWLGIVFILKTDGGEDE